MLWVHVLQHLAGKAPFPALPCLRWFLGVRRRTVSLRKGNAPCRQKDRRQSSWLGHTPLIYVRSMHCVEPLGHGHVYCSSTFCCTLANVVASVLVHAGVGARVFYVQVKLRLPGDDGEKEFVRAWCARRHVPSLSELRG